jgi:ketosteroid isomerase-like protein
MSNSNKDIVLAFLDASVGGDEETMRDLLHPDVRVIEADSLPYGGVAEGPDGFIELIRRVFTTWEETEVSVQQVLGDGDRVVLLAEMTGRGKGNGKVFRMPIAEVWLLDKGKIREVRPYYFDTKLLHDIHSKSD